MEGLNYAFGFFAFEEGRCSSVLLTFSVWHGVLERRGVRRSAGVWVGDCGVVWLRVGDVVRLVWKIGGFLKDSCVSNGPVFCLCRVHSPPIQ